MTQTHLLEDLRYLCTKENARINPKLVNIFANAVRGDYHDYKSKRGNPKQLLAEDLDELHKQCRFFKIDDHFTHKVFCMRAEVRQGKYDDQADEEDVKNLLKK